MKLSDYVTVQSAANKLSSKNNSFSETEQPLPTSKPHPLQSAGNGNASSRQDNLQCEEESDNVSICELGSNTVQLIPSSKLHTLTTVLSDSGNLGHTKVSSSTDSEDLTKQQADYRQRCVSSNRDELTIKSSTDGKGTALSSSPECVNSLASIDDPTNDNPLIATDIKGALGVKERLKNVDPFVVSSLAESVSGYRGALDKVSPSQGETISMEENEHVTQSIVQGKTRVEIDQV